MGFLPYQWQLHDCADHTRHVNYCPPAAVVVPHLKLEPVA
jgi:hypothetical protein